MVPLAARNAAARAREAAFDAAAGMIVAALRLLPAGVRVQVRARLTLVRRLDYPRSEILLRVTSRVERTLRVRSCRKEPETVAWLETFRTGDVFYDVGANVGAYSLIAARLPQGEVRVIAFEPVPETFASLNANILLNGLASRITALPIALNDRTTITEFGHASMEAGSARHPGLATIHVDAGRRSQVVGYRLDDLIQHLGLPMPTHLKIDVDGGELNVLRGAPKTLADRRLRSVLIETSPDAEIGKESIALLRGQGFAQGASYPRGGGEVNLLLARNG